VKEHSSGGRIVLVGGGPGDPGLLTVRGRDRLAEADVILADRLAPVGVLADINPTAEVIDVAKLPRGRFVPQEQINALLVEHAAAGRRVVRLKGGDPFVFGRGIEEVRACVDAGFDVEVVPGVTSAVAVPEVAGIPVTHRGMVQGFTVVSGHQPPGHPDVDLDWQALARAGTTIVALMAVHNLPEITKELLAGGLAADTPAACIRDGGLPTQQVVRGTVSDLADKAAAAGMTPPAVTVIGAVASFAR
jgi:uroporphyrin-III C-methyltransferase